MSTMLSYSEDSHAFPSGLLIAGYGTASFGALLLKTLGAGVLAAGLTFWLGGAVAVIFFGGVSVYSRNAVLAESERRAEFPQARR